MRYHLYLPVGGAVFLGWVAAAVTLAIKGEDAALAWVVGVPVAVGVLALVCAACVYGPLARTERRS
jgi:hypothetical protein